METYCGKQCEECTYKEKLGCRGCQVPGMNGAVDCKIAKCCKEKGHKVCATCGFAPNCTILRGKGSVPDYRLKDMEEADLTRVRNLERAPFLGKWLGILFWLIVPGALGSLLTLDIFQKIPTLYLGGEVINILVNISYGLILLKISVRSERYRTAAICCLIAAGCGVVLALLPDTVMAALTLLLSLPVVVVSFYGEYQEYMGHSDILREMDGEMSGKWEGLWKWYIGTNGAIWGGIILMVIMPVLGALAVLGAFVGVAVVEILKLIYLYRTAKVFQEYR